MPCELRRVLCRVVNPQDFYTLLLHAVHSDIGRGREQKLSGSILTPEAALVREFFQRLNSLVQFYAWSVDGNVDGAL